LNHERSRSFLLIKDFVFVRSAADSVSFGSFQELTRPHGEALPAALRAQAGAAS
jgi:hypothetical protein